MGVTDRRGGGGDLRNRLFASKSLGVFKGSACVVARETLARPSGPLVTTNWAPNESEMTKVLRTSSRWWDARVSILALWGCREPSDLAPAAWRSHDPARLTFKVERVVDRRYLVAVTGMKWREL